MDIFLEYWYGASQIRSSLRQQFYHRSPWLGSQYLSPLVWVFNHNSLTHLMLWWFFVMSRQIQIIPRCFQSQVLLIHSPSSFSPIFLLFSLLDRFQMNLNYIIILSNALSCPFNIGDPMRRSCIPFFLLFCLMLLDWSSFGDFSSNISLLAHLTGVSALIQRFGWDDQSRYFLVPVSYCCTVITKSCSWWSLCLNYIAKLLSCCFPCWTFALILSLFLCKKWVW